MIEVTGKYNTAKIFTDTVDQESIAQVIQLCNQPFCAGSRIRMMPDIHAGTGCTVGTTMTITDKIVPNLVGVDIGCGMETLRLREDSLDFQALDRLIRREIPSGFGVRQKNHPFYQKIDLQKLKCSNHVDLARAAKSMGTLGGGNHFIEVDRDEQGALYLVVHSGSRHLGVETAKYYQQAGWRTLNRGDRQDFQQIAASLRSQGRAQEIEAQIAALKKQRPSISKELAYISGWLMEDYLHDMRLVQQFAALNRQAMLERIVSGLGLRVDESFSTVHNYIDTDAMILRKGAVSAQTEERLLIPINMRDGILICIGLGNEDWNCSAPHGAGRLMSRSAAKAAFSLEEFQRQMEGIYTTSVDRSTLDECPMAYKSMEDIVRCIGPTARIERVIRPVYNFKAGEEKP
jgi:RNA-splicing ligase RtcB